MISGESVKAVQARLQSIFDRRGGYAPRAAEIAATFLVAAQEWGAGNAAAAAFILKTLSMDRMLAIWRAIVGRVDAEFPCRMDGPASAYMLLDKVTGDDDIDRLLLELEYGSRNGDAGFGDIAAAKWADEQMQERRLV